MIMPEKVVGEVNISPRNISIIQKIKNVSDFKERVESSFGRGMTETTEIIFGGAISLNASDIHLEPREENVRLRVRVDGMLSDVLFFNKKIYQNILSRVKVLSGIKLNVSDRPQDGRFSILLKGVPVEIRVSTLPAEYGESIVIRLLNPKNLISLESLGLRKDLFKVFNKEIKKPNGMIIVTGPTGSGKTTTLYAFLKKIQNPEIKIITIEDPIEYHIEGISQTQVDPEHGYDFANGLKAIMRQDPDVILVGEIRDLETASIALQAALTGHLVLSTIHTNDAAGTIARLQSLGEKPVNIAPAINMIIAQRLVRMVCRKCAKEERPNSDELKMLKSQLQGIRSIDDNLRIKRATGCRDCNFTGYQGRTGIFEAFLVDEEIKGLILKSPSISAFRKKLIEKGMITMKQDGLIKVLEGITTIEEVERVAG